MRQRRTEASIFTGLADADVIIGNETCSQEILQVVHLSIPNFIFSIHKYTGLICTAVRLMSSLSLQIQSCSILHLNGKLGFSYFRQYQITGIEHRTAVYRNIKSS